MPDSPSSTTNIPDHVPPELVFEFGGMLLRENREYYEDPFKFWRSCDDAPDLFYTPGTEEGPGRWVVKSAALVREVLQTADPFSSFQAGSPDGGNAWPRRLIPLELDPPEHGKYRALVAKLFSPTAIDAMERPILNLANELIDKFADKGECDFMIDFARPFPVTVFMEMMGLPLERRPQFVKWEHAMFQGDNPEDRMEAGLGVATYLKELIELRRKEPKDDIVTLLCKAEIDGEPIPDENLEDMCFLLYLAGLDTVTGGLSHIFRYLAEHPEARQQLIDDPDLIPGAVEELLRYHAWINIGRTLIRDVEFHGVQMKKGEKVQCMVYNASRDAAEFDKPEEVNFTREPNPHFAFAAGVHRCLGSHLARRELRLAVREWLKRIPHFSIKPNSDLLYNGGLIGLSSMPIEWDVK